MQTSNQNKTTKSDITIKREVLKLRNIYPKEVITLINLIPTYFFYFFWYMVGADSQFWFKDYLWLMAILVITIPLMSYILKVWIIEKTAKKWQITQQDLVRHRFDRSYELINLCKTTKSEHEKRLLIEKINEYVSFSCVHSKGCSFSYTYDNTTESTEYTWEEYNAPQPNNAKN